MTNMETHALPDGGYDCSVRSSRLRDLNVGCGLPPSRHAPIVELLPQRGSTIFVLSARSFRFNEVGAAISRLVPAQYASALDRPCHTHHGRDPNSCVNLLLRRPALLSV
jgi:hypothetical protein